MSNETGGCTCHDCHQRYRVDVILPDELWQRIGIVAPGALLCGPCVLARVESLGEFAAFALVDLVAVEGGGPTP